VIGLNVVAREGNAVDLAGSESIQDSITQRDTPIRRGGPCVSSNCSLALLGVILALRSGLDAALDAFGFWPYMAICAGLTTADHRRGLCMGLLRSAAITIADCRPISRTCDEPGGGFIRVNLRPMLQTSPTK
jgi:hypothetical protein